MEMIAFDEALSITNSSAKVLGSERIPLLESPGRILAVDVTAGRDVPAHDLSAMDGYACRASDRAGPLDVIETIAAGGKPKRPIGPGQCTRIMTGAPLPPGADCVVMFEDAVEDAGVVMVKNIRDKANVRHRAEDHKKGDRILRAGAIIKPPAAAILASEGHDPITVFRRPAVAVIATGDELVEPNENPDDFQIRNSNSCQLVAQILETGCLPTYFGIASDTPEAIGALFDKALTRCDVILLSGGVSAGDFDFVVPMLDARGIKILFNGIAVKPGKPTLFGTANDRFLFGMPGNPVSSLVIFEMLVKPFLYRTMGHAFNHRTANAKLGETIVRRKGDRLEFVPVALEEDHTVRRVPYHGSAHIYAYARASGMIAIPKNVTEMEKDTFVEVILL
jgi:molybdopterin molybdotransferase